MRKRKLIYYVFTAVIFMAVLDYVIKSSQVISDSNNLSLDVFAYVFVISEFLFILGIILMLKGVGFFRIYWRDIFKFNFSTLRLTGKLTYVGFTINRVAAILPWLYVIIFGRNLPLYVILCILIEICIVLIIGFSVKISYEDTIKSRIARLFT